MQGDRDCHFRAPEMAAAAAGNPRAMNAFRHRLQSRVYARYAPSLDAKSTMPVDTTSKSPGLASSALRVGPYSFGL